MDRSIAPDRDSTALASDLLITTKIISPRRLDRTKIRTRSYRSARRFSNYARSGFSRYSQLTYSRVRSNLQRASHYRSHLDACLRSFLDRLSGHLRLGHSSDFGVVCLFLREGPSGKGVQYFLVCRSAPESSEYHGRGARISCLPEREARALFQ